MNQEQIRKNWESRGYSFGVFKDPPGQVWADFVQMTDELEVIEAIEQFISEEKKWPYYEQMPKL